MNYNWRLLAFIVTPVDEPNATVNASRVSAMQGKYYTIHCMLQGNTGTWISKSDVWSSTKASKSMILLYDQVGTMIQLLFTVFYVTDFVEPV